MTDPGQPWFDQYVGTIDIVDLVNLRLLKRFDDRDLGRFQDNYRIVFTTDEKAVIVGPLMGPDIHRIDLTTLTITRTATLPDFPQGINGMALAPAPD